MRCRLYLVTPPDFESGGVSVDDFRRKLEAALSGGDVASLLIRGDVSDETLNALAAALTPVAQAADVAVLVEGRCDVADAHHCDGVHLEARPASLRAVRRALGRDAILGADCGDSRHLAMVAGELDCDYVSFDAQARETIAWWAEMMEVPCVAWGEVDLEGAPALIDAGADFLAVGRAVWDHAEGPAEAVRAFNALFDAKAGESGT
ncbi:thiE [Symbiodinium necroappetens]|uniref:ThiE protein n=1 Tax=Symbiodinium necroappetens TaxID=1628268 RepID=A0A812W8I6_9DINO|nr:thiE [Symbiodinium necroappetens]